MKTILLRKICSLVVLAAFTFSSIFGNSPAVAQQLLNLPAPGSILFTSPQFQPTLIKGISLNPENPLEFNFIIHPGDEKREREDFEKESLKLIKYFMAALTVPENEMWVNLSPYEKDRIIPEGFRETEMGRDLLAQDYLLKQLSSSLLSPEGELGKEFWNKIQSSLKDTKSQGHHSIGDMVSDDLVTFFNKIWIIPQNAQIYENGKSVFVIDSHLKVMMEEDYLALEANQNLDNRAVGYKDTKSQSHINGDMVTGAPATTQVLRELLLPVIEREVNEGKSFAPLRQIYNSVILATWFKQNLKESILNKIYSDQNKTDGLQYLSLRVTSATSDEAISEIAASPSAPRNDIEMIYDQYLKAFQKGAYDMIKEDYDPQTQTVIPRKYFGGGVHLADIAMNHGATPSRIFIDDLNESSNVKVQFNSAMIAFEEKSEAGVKFLARKQELPKQEVGDLIPHLNERIDEAKTLFKEYLGLDDVDLTNWGEEFNVDITIADLGRQTPGSFKMWLAYGILKAILDPNRHVDTLVSATTGNQGIALNFIANKLNERFKREGSPRRIKVKIFADERIPKEKMERMRQINPQVEFVHAHPQTKEPFKNYDEATQGAVDFSSPNRDTMHFIHHADKMAMIGYAAMGEVILKKMLQNKDLDQSAIFIPLGAGGLAGGIALAARRINPNIKIILVQTDRTKHGYNSFKLGRPEIHIDVDDGEYLEEGIDTKKMEQEAFDVLNRLADAVVLVDKDKVEPMMQEYKQKDIIVEGASVLPHLAVRKLAQTDFFQKNKIDHVINIATGRNSRANLKAVNETTAAALGSTGFNAERIMQRIEKNSQRDQAVSREVGVRLGLYHSIFYYTLLETLGLDDNYAHEINLDKIYLLYHQSASVADDIMAKFGHLLNPQEWDAILKVKEEYRVPFVSVEFLKQKGVSEAEMASIPSSNFFPDDRRNRVTVVHEVEGRVKAILDTTSTSPAIKEGIVNAFRESTQKIYESFAWESVIGLYPSLADVRKYLRLKTSDFMVILVKRLHEAFPANVELMKNTRIMDTCMYLLQVMDDFADFEEDYNVQPNIFLSLAANNHPEELQRLQERLQGNKTRIHNQELATLAPQTLKDIDSEMETAYNEINEIDPTFAEMLKPLLDKKYTAVRATTEQQTTSSHPAVTQTAILTDEEDKDNAMNMQIVEYALAKTEHDIADLERFGAELGLSTVDFWEVFLHLSEQRTFKRDPENPQRYTSFIATYNADGTPTGRIKDYWMVKQDRDWHKFANVFVFSSSGKLFLQVRKDGTLDASAGGGVEVKMNTLQTGVKEANEELELELTTESLTPVLNASRPDGLFYYDFYHYEDDFFDDNGVFHAQFYQHQGREIEQTFTTVLTPTQEQEWRSRIGRNIISWDAFLNGNRAIINEEVFAIVEVDPRVLLDYFASKRNPQERGRIFAQGLNASLSHVEIQRAILDFAMNGNRLSNVEPIHSPIVRLQNRSHLKQLVEEPLLAATEILYDKNIETLSSSANNGHLAYKTPASILINFDTLSEENQKIGLELGEIIMDFRFKNRVLMISIPYVEDPLVSEISSKAVSLVNQFKQQKLLGVGHDLQYYRGHYNLPDLAIEDLTGYFRLVHDPQTGLFYMNAEELRRARGDPAMTELTANDLLSGWEMIEGIGNILAKNKNTKQAHFLHPDAFLPHFAAYIVRHGETLANLEDRLQGDVDDDTLNQLTTIGKEQAIKAAKLLIAELKKVLKPNQKIIVVTSPLGRARDTATPFINLLKEELGITVELRELDYLREINNGLLENAVVKDLPEADAKTLQERRSGNVEAKVGGKESIEDKLRETFEGLTALNDEMQQLETATGEKPVVIFFGHSLQLNVQRALFGDQRLLDPSKKSISFRVRNTPNAVPMKFDLFRREFNPVDNAMVELTIDKLKEELITWLEQLGNIEFRDLEQLEDQFIRPFFRRFDEVYGKTILLDTKIVGDGKGRIYSRADQEVLEVNLPQGNMFAGEIKLLGQRIAEINAEDGQYTIDEEEENDLEKALNSIVGQLILLLLQDDQIVRLGFPLVFNKRMTVEEAGSIINLIEASFYTKVPNKDGSNLIDYQIRLPQGKTIEQGTKVPLMIAGKRGVVRRFMHEFKWENRVTVNQGDAVNFPLNKTWDQINSKDITGEDLAMAAPTQPSSGGETRKFYNFKLPKGVSKAAVWSEFLGDWTTSFGGLDYTDSFWSEIFKSHPAKSKILDIGTGNFVLPRIAGNINRFQIWALDSSQRRGAMPPEGVQFVHSIAENLASTVVPDDLNLVVSQYGLEYTNWRRVLPAIAKKMKEGAEAVFLIHHPDSIIAERAKYRLQQYQLIHEKRLFEKALAFFENPPKDVIRFQSNPKAEGFEEAYLKGLALYTAFEEIKAEYNKRWQEIHESKKEHEVGDILLETLKTIESASTSYDLMKWDRDRYIQLQRSFAKLQRDRWVIQERIRAVFDQKKMEEFVQLASQLGLQVDAPSVLRHDNENLGWIVKLKKKTISSTPSEDPAIAAPGGIDLNPSQIEFEKSGNGMDLDLPNVSVEELQNINGFIPVIINITPVTNVPLLLGIADLEEEEQISRAF